MGNIRSYQRSIYRYKKEHGLLQVQAAKSPFGPVSVKASTARRRPEEGFFQKAWEVLRTPIGQLWRRRAAS